MMRAGATNPSHYDVNGVAVHEAASLAVFPVPTAYAAMVASPMGKRGDGNMQQVRKMGAISGVGGDA